VVNPAEVPGTEEAAIEVPEAESRGRGIPASLREFGLAAAIVGIATLISLALRPYLAPTNLVMVYLLGVVAVATRCSRRTSVIASFVSLAAFDFFCVPPYLTFQVSEYEYLITFAGMLAVALVISAQTARIRTQAARAVDRESRTQALYRLSRRLAAQTRVFDAAMTAAEVAEEVFGLPVTIFLPEDGRISFRKRTSSQLPISSAEQEIAQTVFDQGRKAGRGMERYSDAAATYLPLKGASRIVGVMAIIPGSKNKSLLTDQQHLLDLFANQTALAIERTLSQNAADEARMRMETEEIRSSLLSAVSHDLRTPLASITGAASTLRSQGAKLDPAVRDELLESISDEAMRLSRLVGNLLDMTRLESGVELRRDLYPLEEIVGAALHRLERQLAGREVTVSLSDDLPLVYVDDVLLGQVLVNLIENAVKYSPPGSTIEIAAEATVAAVQLEIRDRGAGFAAGDEKRLFEKFYRGKSEGVGGAGLGLAICRAIVVAHRGTIEALHRTGGGAIFRIRLPLDPNP